MNIKEFGNGKYMKSLFAKRKGNNQKLGYTDERSISTKIDIKEYENPEHFQTHIIIDEDIAYRMDIFSSDIKKIKSILESSDCFSHSEINIAIELAKERLRKGKGCGYYFMFAEHMDELILGYSCFGPIPCTVDSFDIYWLAVHRKFQNRGIGKSLLTKTESEIALMGGRSIYIETSSRIQYKRAHMFYNNMGYKLKAILKDFYSSGDDKLIYRKRI